MVQSGIQRLLSRPGLVRDLAVSHRLGVPNHIGAPVSGGRASVVPFGQTVRIYADEGSTIDVLAEGERYERDRALTATTLPFDAAELTGWGWSAAGALRLRHVPSPAGRVPERAERGHGPHLQVLGDAAPP